MNTATDGLPNWGSDAPWHRMVTARRVSPSTAWRRSHRLPMVKDTKNTAGSAAPQRIRCPMANQFEPATGGERGGRQERLPAGERHRHGHNQHGDSCGPPTVEMSGVVAR